MMTRQLTFIVRTLSTRLHVDITNTTSITAVKTIEQRDRALESREKEVEDYLVSLCKKISDSKPTTKETDEKVIREFETVTMDKCKYGLTMSMEELVPIVISNDELLMKFTRIDLFRKVLQDLPLMKDIIFTNPLVISFLDLNPGLRECLEDDQLLQSLVNIVLTPESILKKQKHEAIAEIIEPRLGRKLVFTSAQVTDSESNHL